jgi:myosin V
MALLDKLRTERMGTAATTVQRHVRGYLTRLRFQAIKTAAALLQRATRTVLARREAQRRREQRAALIIQVLRHGCAFCVRFW